MRAVALTLFFFATMDPAPAQSPALVYPPSKKLDVSDDYHGTKVADPYRWLEDDNATDTKAWVKAQNEVTFSWLDKIPQRAAIRERLTKLWNYERFSTPRREGGRYFFNHNTGLQNQGVLKVAEGLEAEPRVLLDPNLLSPDGTVSLSSYEATEDGKLLAYGLSRAGSDWTELRVRDVATGTDREDFLRWVKFSGVSWAKDGSGFYYSRFDEPKDGAALTGKNEFHKLWFHRLGTPQKEDALIYERPDHPGWLINGRVTDDGRYLMIYLSEGADPKNRVFYKDLGQPDAKVVELLPDGDANYSNIDNVGTLFYFMTDHQAPRYRVIAIDITKPQRENWREVIPQGADKLDNASLVGGQLICEYLHDASSVARCFDLEGKLIRELALPGIGSISGFSGEREDKDTFYNFTSFTAPNTVYRLDVASGTSTVWRMPTVDIAADAFETRQVFVPSKDGTRIPVFLVHKRGIKLDGSHPTILYGYGGFEISLTPWFSPFYTVWLEMGGVLAVANLRGGGEYGSEWHEAGTKLRKQTVFDDFIAAAEWLARERYTSRARLGIKGGSNGGLLVGACMTQRPELFGAAVPSVGVMDMLRFHKFTIGKAWVPEYGISEDPAEFAALYAYSPLHRLKEGARYPATMVKTADHDDRVVPAHSFKFAARLQECQAEDGPPVLIRVETSAGHGAGTALTKMIDENADELSFFAKVLGMP